jgi:hypothetical protein
MKPGGTSEVDLKSIIFSNGEPIFVWGKASGQVVDPTPIGKSMDPLRSRRPLKNYDTSTQPRACQKLSATRNGRIQFKIYAVK